MKYKGLDGFTEEDILSIKEEDEKFSRRLKVCEAKENYEKMYKHIQEVGFGGYIDVCVDAENCLDEDGNFLTEKDGEIYWKSMHRNMIDSVGMRLEEQGICASDYGIPY